MERHPFDPLSFVFGLGFTTLGSWVLLAEGDPELLEARWLWPAMLIAGGVALLASVWRQSREARAIAAGEIDLEMDDHLAAARAELPDDPFTSR